MFESRREKYMTDSSDSCEPEMGLGENLLVPDVAGWRRERMPAWPAPAGTTKTPR